jgi:uncharacterized protein
MKLHVTQVSGQNVFTGYGKGYVAVNNERHEQHLLVMPDRLLTWDVAGFEALDSFHVERLLAFEPEIVILGTGAALRFPGPRFARPVTAAGIGLEVMDSQAACRTYNILASEGRRVLAAVFVA